MPNSWTEAVVIPPQPAGYNIGNIRPEDEQSLVHAFHSFAQAAGSLERSYGQLQDEVGRLRAELATSHQELAESLEQNKSMRAHLDRILEALPCGVLVIAADGSVTRVNPEALRLLGAENAIPTCLDALPDALQEWLRTNLSGDQERELAVTRLDNSRLYMAARHASLPAEELQASVVILRDITERKRLEQAQDKLRREKALADMSSMLAHEIRNPLGSLELFAGLLVESELNGECREWVEHIQAGLRTLAATVNNVLHFHSLPDPERAPLDAGRLLTWARDFFRPLAQQSGITLSLQNRLTGVFVEGDRHRLEQVLLNLILNAVRAMPGGGWIELGGTIAGGGSAVCITISDTGPGIPQEHLARIFEAGFSTRPSSPGLGLAVCRKIVEQHRGNIHVVNRSGGGATFTVTLPLTPATEGAVFA